MKFLNPVNLTLKASAGSSNDALLDNIISGGYRGHGMCTNATLL